MAEMFEVVLQLEAKNLPREGHFAKARVLRSVLDGALSCHLEPTFMGVEIPKGPFSTPDQARDAIVSYWQKCSE